jgi:hypothetical protein
VDPILIPILAVASAPIIAIGLPIARAYARRLEAEAVPARVPSEVVARLERMEQAIDAIALEVERIAEGQRFTARLLSEQAHGAALPGAAARERANAR